MLERRRLSGAMSKLLLLPFFFLGCLSSEVEEPPGPPTVGLLAAYGHDTETACDLYRALVGAGPEANVFFSPASITAALSMVAEGARGASAAELARALQGSGSLDLDALRAVRADLAKRLRAASRDLTWSEANGIWSTDQAELMPETQEALRAHHGASVERADFRGSSDPVRREINAWVEEKTEGRIKDLLPSGSVDAMTKLVLVNAVYFLGKWEDEFELESTKDQAFFHADGTETSVPFLRDWRDMPVAFFDAKDEATQPQKDAVLTVFELPYRGGQLSFVGLIPESASGLAELEERLSAQRLNKWLGGLREQRADFAMPKLELEPSYDLKPVFQSLGLGSLLSPATANLEGFFGPEAESLHVTGAYHSAFLKIDEVGTEAAAATGVVAGITSAVGPPPKVHADRPYLFLIRERASGAILFMGRVVNP